MRCAAPTGPGGFWRRAGATGERYALASTQFHHALHGRDLVRTATLDSFRAVPGFAQDRPVEPPSIYPEYPYPGHAWAMTIDLDACLGCNPCVVTCQAENNVPVVGKAEVARHREIHWLRIDRCHAGPPSAI